MMTNINHSSYNTVLYNGYFDKTVTPLNFVFVIPEIFTRLQVPGLYN